MVQKIDVNEALKESNTHQRFLYTSLFLVLLLVCSLLAAAWWYGSTLRERKVSRELLIKSKQLEAKTHLLNAINDNISDFIFLANGEMRLFFGNSMIAGQFGFKAAELLEIEDEAKREVPKVSF